MITIIGIDDSGELLPRHRQLVDGADLLCGGERHLNLFPGDNERLPIKGKLAAIASALETRLQDNVVVLASGDPLFFGIGAYLIKKLGAEHVHIEPSVSTMQMAFARVKLSWQDARLVSVHGKPLANLDEACAASDLIGVFTDATHHPVAIAEYCNDKGYGPFDAWICQNLGGTDETLWQGPLEEVANNTYSELNVTILRRRQGEAPPALDLDSLPIMGLRDDQFIYRAPSRGLITKQEVRVVSLAQMQLTPSATVWDVGAGSGSVTVECARLCSTGQVYAIEKNRADFDLITTNLDRFGVSNATLINDTAPKGMDDWPRPDAIFIGGASATLEEVVSLASAKQIAGGRLVINAITLETITRAQQALSAAGYEVSMRLVQISRSKPILNLTRWDALNPITIISGVHP